LEKEKIRLEAKLAKYQSRDENINNNNNYNYNFYGGNYIDTPGMLIDQNGTSMMRNIV